MFKRILVPLDGSRLAEGVLPHAVSMAQAFEAHLTVLRVLERASTDDGTETVDPLSWHIRKAEAEAYLEEIVSQLGGLGIEVEPVLLEGPAAKRIVELAHEQKTDLIALSSHGRSGLYEWNVSSVVHKTILQAMTSILLVRAYQTQPTEVAGLRYHKIMAPLDCSQRAECALPAASYLAIWNDAQLLLPHVVERPQVPRRGPLSEHEQQLVDGLIEANKQDAANYLAEVKARQASDADTRLLVSDNPAAALHNLAEEEEVDLVLLCAHGNTGGTWAYGGMALNFISYGSTSLLIVQDLPREMVERTEAERAVAEVKGH